MQQPDVSSRTGDVTCLVMAAIFLAGFAAVAIKLKDVQLDNVASITSAGEKQMLRRIRTPGERGRILASDGTVLASNRPVRLITLNPEHFQSRTQDMTATNIHNAVESAAIVVGRDSPLSMHDIERHIKRNLARPLIVWRDVTDSELARFAEHEDMLPGFECEETLVREYPEGSLASHVLGYVGRDRVDAGSGERRFNYVEFEMRGRAGLEERYDSFLRGAPGEDAVTVDARGFARKEWTVVPPQNGPDLILSLDVAMQRAAEEQLRGLKGACVALDPRNGAVLAMASSPDYNANLFVPVLTQELWQDMSNDPSKPLLNRAISGSYAPGSTFKPVTALAGMGAGFSPAAGYECTGAYRLGKMSIRCTHLWGHDPPVLDLTMALKESCNPFFCDLGMRAGTNALIMAARKAGLGARTHIDLPGEAQGIVPDDEWKRANWGEKWYPGDLAQMSIGQGMLLVTPLQMARLAGGLGTGKLATPHLKAGEKGETEPLPFPEWQLEAVRKGMKRVVKDGTGRKAGTNLAVEVAGKTGTAEVGRGATRRKNAWFIAYAPAANPTVALAIVIENGETGGATAAPKAREILKARFGELAQSGGKEGA